MLSKSILFPKMSKFLPSSLLTFLLACFCQGAPVSIADHSFESNPSGDLSGGGTSWSNNLSPEWEETGGPSNGSGFEEYIAGFSAEGTDHLGMNAGHEVWQDLGETYQANTIYTLTVAVGHRAGQTGGGNQSTYSLRASDGTSYATESYDASLLTAGSFADGPNDAILDTSLVPAAVGKTIRIHLLAGGSGRSHFDNIRLDATAIEPNGSAILNNTAATSVTNATATLNGTVTNIGDAAPAITLFYGTSDGGTNPAAWDSSLILPGTHSGNFSGAISGLLPSQSYFFTARAINSAGTSWATPSLSFDTLSNPPSITQGSATAITAISASLPVTITDNGGEDPVVTIYYGTSDGGTLIGNWNSSVSLGTVTGSASASISGLTPSTPYFFRARATNEGGTTWTTASGSFSTTVVMAPTIDNRSVGSLTAISAALRGEVTDTGSQEPSVTIFYGISDGGNTPASWDFSVNVGAESGNYSRFVTGLTPATTYYYTARAVNSAGTSWAPASETFVTPNALASQVVINEIHYDPVDETSPAEFIELYNPGTSSIDLSGWMLTDAVDFTFPQGTVIGANGYLVIGEDPTTLNTVFGVTALGPWVGGLRNDGEEIDLRDASGTLQDQVNYDAGFPWPTGARGGGGSMELINPVLDNNLASSWRTSGSTINTEPGPIATYISAADSNWRYRKGTSEASSPTTAWREIAFSEDASWFTGQTPIGYGDGDDNTVLNDMQNNYSTVYLRHEFIVNALEIPQQLKLRIYADDGAIVWINGQEVRRIYAPAGNLAFNANGQNHEAAWEEFILAGANTYLVGGTNVIAVHGLNAGTGSSDFSIDISLESTNDTSSGGAPSPGAANSSSSSLTPPAIRQVDHFPGTPTSSDPVSITAKITDPEGVGAVTLDYQIVNPGSYIRLTDAAYTTSWTTVTMLDDGTNGDLISGDSIYTVVLPASVQSHRRLIRYRINFEDSAGTSDTAPYTDDKQPNFAYFVYDGIPSWAGSFTPGGTVENFPDTLMDDLPVYHLIANNTDVINSQYSGGSDGIHMPGTLVYNGKVYDHVEFENRGEASTYVSGKNKWRFHFNRARRFAPIDNWGVPYESKWSKLNLQSISSPWAAVNRGMAGLDESLTMRLYALAGIPSPRTHYFSFRVIDNATEASPIDQYEGDVWGLYLAMEQPNGSFLDDRNLADGNIYKIEGGAGDKKEQGNTQVTSSADWNTFYSASNSGQNPQWWRDNMNMPGYYSMRSLNRFLGNVDIRIGYNHYFYHEPSQDQWHVMPWDLDMMYIAETHQAGVIRQQNSILQNPELMLEFRNRAREILDLVGSDASPTGGQIGQLVDEYTDIVNPQGQALTWADVDAFMWNYHPRTNGAAGNASGQTNHKGNFYASPFNDSRIGGSYTRTLISRDHEGLVNHIIAYTTDNYPGGTWTPGNGIPAGYGYEYLNYEAADNNIPNKPSLTYDGPAGYPANQLFFTSGSFSDPNGNGTFGKMRWRIAKILAPGLIGYVENTPRSYEIESVLTSPDINSFDANYLFPADASEPGVTYRVRVQHEDATGRTSHWSDPVEFVTGVPSIDLWQDNLVISEIMYNPAQPDGTESLVSADNDDFEFIEITNISDSLTLDLSDLDFTAGITFDFANATSTSIAPGASVLLVRNQAAFEARYGNSLPVIGVYPNALSNGGEQITLSFALNTPILDFTYDDIAPWPTSPDGGGYSLVLIDPTSGPDHSLAASWTAGTVIGGTPGAPEPDLTGLEQFLSGFLTPSEMADPAISGPLADPDGDGFSNVLEYAFLGNPLSSGSLVTHDTVDSGGMTYPSISFLKRSPSTDLTYTPQLSGDLAGWDEGSSFLIEESSIDQGNGSNLVTVRSLTPVSGTDRQFLRVKVVHTNP